LRWEDDCQEDEEDEEIAAASVVDVVVVVVLLGIVGMTTIASFQKPHKALLPTTTSLNPQP
jgi:hypothetical protein